MSIRLARHNVLLTTSLTCKLFDVNIDRRRVFKGKHSLFPLCAAIFDVPSRGRRNKQSSPSMVGTRVHG